MAGERVLHIIGSPRGLRSRSTRVSRRLLARLGVSAEELDLHATDLPALDAAAIEGRYALVEGREVDPIVCDRWRRVRDTIEHFLSFDTVLFSVPMWNFGVPWRLKQYIDIITQPDLMFNVDGNGVTGLAGGRRAILVCSGALDIRPEEPGEEMDFQTSYMKAWLGFIGITDVRIVQVRPTYGTPARVEEAMDIAFQEVDALAESLLRAPRV
ncbi:FMN-dependent NADH-azoreductase [Novosphingobium cyanobacteriorum]|uniref:FMN dependent NADH:quinone oxidoreductase n=1 Tax=Novosphingobium cyanobacteriorum TaxID=3024215 RepID=A0ABT6CLA9_9SPHN|nr:NAD(P)H-dependent oxidoreductase [Novosphingobium cyanobacteriorum]MDF8334632.1 NAD(P)H-dependent oxidoreductase [Novosphingobium cyanobacteriorum]